MTDIFNQIGLSAGTFGNHEFADGIVFLKHMLKMQVIHILLQISIQKAPILKTPL